MKLSGIFSYVRSFDWLLLANVCLLAIVGIIAIYSVALGSQDPLDMTNFKKQVVFFVGGIGLIFGMGVLFDYRMLVKHSTAFFVVSAALLLLVLLAGKTIKGTTGWFVFGGVSFQPVELVKIAVIIFLSKFFSDKAKYIGR